MKALIVILVILAVFFGFPMMNDVAFPQSFAPEEIGNFISNSVDYWKNVFSNVFG